ncbi:hypothetical protein BD410DRAFT_846358 [Rickenella mellea]|uniref:Uncharacterized protein n=1 Tax=Rickenella mellea TaxID=50990 RepID=A0A4Y7PFJ6_9AGAM|nr:hypothetical protein BD410DRAFT_846358 [Rickenella mellea]
MITESTLSTNTMVSTTRVPVFNDEMQNPTNGYRHLGPLSAVSFGFQPLGTYTDLGREIFAIDIEGVHPATQDYARILQPAGISMDSHFIIILTSDISLPTSSRGSSPFAYSRSQSLALTAHTNSASGSPSHSLTNSLSPSPLQATVLEFPNLDIPASGFSSELLMGHDQVDHFHSATATPFSGNTHHISNFSFNSNTFQENISHSPGLQAESISNFVTPGDSIPVFSDPPSAPAPIPLPHSENISLSPQTTEWELMDILGITGVEKEKATYLGDNNRASLFTLVQNHQAASELLVKMGFPKFENDPLAKISVTFAPNVTFTGCQILAHLKWSASSYGKKSLAYTWAKEASQLKWKGNVPDEPSDAATVYKIWQEIVEMFKPGGFLETNTDPRTYGTSPQLKQKDLFTPSRTRIANYLENI